MPYPLTAGPEIVGRVTETGGEVTKHTVGDRLGVGGCSIHIVVDEDFVLRVPETIAYE